VPLFDTPKIVSEYLDAKNGEITKAIFHELEAYVLRKIRAVEAKRPKTLVNGEDGSFATVALGHYIPEENLSLVATFTVRILNHGNAAIADSSWTEYHLSTNWEVRAIGDGAGLLQGLIGNESPGVLGRYLVDYAQYKHQFSAVGDVAGDMGAKVVANVVHCSVIVLRPRPGTKKVGLPLGTGSPEKARSIVSVVFTPTRGVIHPSFPLRGRWERFAKNDEQAPSPSLAAFYISSCKTRLHSL
jgi:hypothetical protein